MRIILAASAIVLMAATQVPPQAPCTGTSNTFTVTQSGFTDPSGHPWNARGVNMDTKDVMSMANGQFFQQFPGTTYIRLAADGGSDTADTLDPIVLAVTGAGRVLSIEDHHDTQGGQNIGFYTMIAQHYGSNPLVWAETPNEPPASMTGAPQANIINAMRSAGFKNPIGIQPICCEDQSNVPAVLGAVTSQANLYVSMHVYCGGGDASCPTNYPASATQPTNGLFHLINEFGDAANGMNHDQYGYQLIAAITNMPNGIFWHCCNGFHDTDSACTSEGCSSLTTDGKMLQPWLSSTQQGSCSLVTQTSAPSSATQAILDPLQQQIDSLTQSANDLLSKATEPSAPATNSQQPVAQNATTSQPAGGGVSSCSMSQSQLDGIAQSVWSQVQGDQVPECGLNGSGTGQKGTDSCVPITLAPGDVLPGDGSSVTDAQGNTWALSIPTQDGNGHWYGGIIFNGQQVDNGYYAALRQAGGTVYAEEAKGAGWQVADSSNPGDTGNAWKYVPAPQGGSCGGALTAPATTAQAGPATAQVSSAAQRVQSLLGGTQPTGPSAVPASAQLPAQALQSAEQDLQAVLQQLQQLQATGTQAPSSSPSAAPETSNASSPAALTTSSQSTTGVGQQKFQPSGPNGDKDGDGDNDADDQ